MIQPNSHASSAGEVNIEVLESPHVSMHTTFCISWLTIVQARHPTLIDKIWHLDGHGVDYIMYTQGSARAKGLPSSPQANKNFEVEYPYMSKLIVHKQTL